MYFSQQHYASRNGNTEICSLLLQKGASPNFMTRSGRVTSLHRAAYKGHIDIVQLLLQHKADPTLQDSDGKTSLHKVNNSKEYTYLMYFNRHTFVKTISIYPVLSGWMINVFTQSRYQKIKEI